MEHAKEKIFNVGKFSARVETVNDGDKIVKAC